MRAIAIAIALLLWGVHTAAPLPSAGEPTQYIEEAIRQVPEGDEPGGSELVAWAREVRAWTRELLRWGIGLGDSTDSPADPYLAEFQDGARSAVTPWREYVESMTDWAADAVSAGSPKVPIERHGSGPNIDPRDWANAVGADVRIPIGRCELGEASIADGALAPGNVRRSILYVNVLCEGSFPAAASCAVVASPAGPIGLGCNAPGPQDGAPSRKICVYDVGTVRATDDWAMSCR